MSCTPKTEVETEDGIRDAHDCKCYSAVMRTYSAMSDEPRQVALYAARRVYRYHHPEDSRNAADLTVERWINAGHVH